ncbi:MAG: carboxypeptidase-like regulatory domain-containing protein, partial [Dehalococcoidia bacterium]
MKTRKMDSRKGMDRLNLAGSWAAVLIFAVAALFVTIGTANADPPTGSISGTVIEAATSTPLEGAVVFVNDAQTGDAAGNATTAANGTYTVSGLATGSYRVQVNATSLGYPIIYYNSASGPDTATAVAVVNAVDTPSIDFSLSTGGSISGIVRKASDSSPVANADVWANDYDGGGGHGTRTAGDGTYTITGLAPGDYRVESSANDLGLVHEYYPETFDWGLADRVAVTTGATTTSIDFTLGSGGSISGVVLQADTDTPVSNADIWANSFDGGGGNGTRTAGDGTYTITGLAAGDYRVQVNVEGQNLAGEFYNDTTDWSMAERVTVTSGATTANIDFSLAAGGSISGVVLLDGTTTPVVGADVWADTYDCCGGNGTRTGSDGTYTITGLAPGDYRVQVHIEEQDLAGEFYNDTTDWFLAGRVAVTAGATTTGIDFSLAAGGSISGVVLQDGTSTPVADADVWADSYDCCGGGSGTRTAADGTYTITGLTPGDYRVQVHVEGQNLTSEFYNDAADWFLAAKVAVTAGATTANIDFSLAGGGAISGTVLKASDSSPVANAEVFTYSETGGWGWTNTGSDGAYTITGLAPGDYRVQMHVEGQDLAGQFYNNTTDWGLATLVAVTSGATTANIDFSLAAGGSISGSVLKDSDSSPIANADVWADSYDCCGGGSGTRTASDGTYTITGLAPGDYRVQVHLNGQDLAGEFYNDTTEWDQATKVTVTAGATTTSIDFSLSAGGSVSGVVLKDSDSTAVANADVWANSYDGGGGNGTRTASDGSYTISGLAPGDYRVEVHMQGQDLAGEFYNDTTDWFLADRVAVTAGGTTPNIDFSVAGGGSITGVVLKASDSSPIPNADIWANSYDCCGGGNGTRTGSDGTYTINGLAPGDYRVEVHVQGQSLAGQFYNNTTEWDQAARVAVSASATTPNIDFSLAAGGSIT